MAGSLPGGGGGGGGEAAGKIWRQKYKYAQTCEDEYTNISAHDAGIVYCICMNTEISLCKED